MGSVRQSHTIKLNELTVRSTRNFEMLSMNLGDIQLRFKTPELYSTLYFKVTLQNRKGWQKEAGFDSNRSSECP